MTKGNIDTTTSRSLRSTSRAGGSRKLQRSTLDATKVGANAGIFASSVHSVTGASSNNPPFSGSKRKRCDEDDRTITSSTSSVSEGASSSNTASMVTGFPGGDRQSLLPGKVDCVFGRGKDVDQRPGNIALRRTISRYLTRYQDATCRLAKNRIQREIVSSVKETGARFMVQDKRTKLWAVVSDEKARVKVGQQIRYQIQHNSKELEVEERVVEARTQYYDPLSKLYDGSSSPPPLADMGNEGIFSV